jgi:hypothetical protein
MYEDHQDIPTLHACIRIFLTLRINFEDIVSKILCDDIDLSNFYNIIVGATKLTYAKEISTT